MMDGFTLIMLALTSPLWGSMLIAIVFFTCMGISEIARAWRGK